jgi:hypothetical protein
LRRNCLLKHVIEGKIEVRGREGRRRKHLPDDIKEKRGYCYLKEKHSIALCGELALKKRL